MLVRIIPVGTVSEKLLKEVSGGIENTLGVKTRVMEKLVVPKESYNALRRQHDADKMIDLLCKNQVAQYIDKDVPALFITDADLYADKMNFAFAVEDPVYSVSVISLARLKTEFYGQGINLYLLGERAAKEAIHTLGHQLGLEHCFRPTCVMSPSPSAGDVDKKQKIMCRDCEVKVSKVISLPR